MLASRVCLSQCVNWRIASSVCVYLVTSWQWGVVETGLCVLCWVGVFNHPFMTLCGRLSFTRAYTLSHIHTPDYSLINLSTIECCFVVQEISLFRWLELLKAETWRLNSEASPRRAKSANVHVCLPTCHALAQARALNACLLKRSYERQRYQISAHTVDSPHKPHYLPRSLPPSLPCKLLVFVYACNCIVISLAQ